MPAARFLYNQCVGGSLRIYYEAYLYLKREEQLRQVLLRNYRDGITSQSTLGEEYHDYESLEFYIQLSNYLKDIPDLHREAIYFWLRRFMDGTAEQFAELILEVIEDYDCEWLESLETNQT